MYIVFLYLAILAVAALITFALFGEAAQTEVDPDDALNFFSPTAEGESCTAHGGNTKAALEHIRACLVRSGVPSQQQQMISFLGQRCCVLPVESHTVRVLTHPARFYEELKRHVMQAQRSVTLSALYIGDGPLSNAFVACLEEKVRWAVAGGHPFSITILLDYNRMQDRKNLVTLKTLMELAERTCGSSASSPNAEGKASLPSSESALDLDREEAEERHDDTTRRVTVRLFLYQNPSPWNRLFAPLGRAKEVLGVQHTKIFVFDQRHTILTGANLSDDYFATRMDRYLVVEENRYVGQWFTALVRTLNHIAHPVICRKEYHDTYPGESVSARDAIPLPEEEEGKDTAEGNGDNKGAPDCTYRQAEKPASPLRKALNTAGQFMQMPGSPISRAGSPTLHRRSNLVILPNALAIDPSIDTAAFCAKTKELLHGFAAWTRYFSSAQSVEWTKYDSFLFPTVQVGRAGIYHDSVMVKQLLRFATAEDHVFLTSPYLNMYASFVDEVLAGRSYVDCITASVKTNGWNGQKGMAGRIPLFYLQLERSFYFMMKAYRCLHRVGVREFSVEGLTFHAKGLWFTGHVPPSEYQQKSTEKEDMKEWQREGEPSACTPESISAPYLVAYGSTNYGYRSVHKDVEAEAFLLTTNDELRATLRQELLFLLKQSTPVTEAEFVGTAVGRFQPVISLIAHLGQDFL